MTSGTELKSEIFYKGVGSEGGTFCVLSRVASQLKTIGFDTIEINLVNMNEDLKLY